MTTNTVSTRRRFFWGAAAALSTAAGIAVMEASAAPRGDGAEFSRARLDALGAIGEIRALAQQLARHINAGEPERLAGLFEDSAAHAALAGLKRLAPADFGGQDAVELAADLESASLKLQCTVEIEAGIDAEGTPAEMARLQGDAMRRVSATRVLEAGVIKRRGAWKFTRLTLTTKKAACPGSGVSG